MAKTTRIPNAHEIDSVSTNPHGQDRGDDAAVKTHGVNARHDQNGHENASVEPRTRNSTAGTAVMTQPSTLAMMCFPPLLYMPVPERAAFLSLPLCSSLPMPKGAVSDGSMQRMYAAIRTPKRGHLLPLSPLLSSPKIFSLPLTEVQLLGRENFVFAARVAPRIVPSCPVLSSALAPVSYGLYYCDIL
ncbi:hypothetical protein F5148DRAFT_1147902 [Russula earlei]|uniref:Uncharacterized protein n=1 Tax=Russula earlei TaxID=71964 RepID=A0ACC0UDY0_9AGAM|nr:hypothetical protein F5148DRAFT_1147902 [Russula earlei]